MLKIALTGGISCGKTTTLSFFRQLRIPTIDCDAIVGQLYRREGIKKELLKEFGTVDKKKIAEIIFSNKTKRRKLESILHPAVLREVKQQLQRFRKAGRKLVVIDIPLLFEAKLQRLADIILVVKCTRQQQLQRLQKQGFTRKEALQRISAQIPLRKKIKKAHYVIDNSGSKPKTRAQVKKLLGELNG